MRRGRDVVAASAGVATLAASWVVALRQPIHPVEQDVHRALNDLPEAMRLVWPVMQLGSLAAVPAVAGAVLALWRSPRLAGAVLGAGATSWLAAKWVKDQVGRERPAAYLTDTTVREATSGLGFVSGHAAVSAAMAVTILPYAPRRWRRAIVAAAGVVGASRIYFGAHLPVDVIGGFGLGAALGAAANLIVGVPSPSPAADVRGADS